MAQLSDGFVLDLADPLPGDAEDLAHFLQGVGPSVEHAEPHPQYFRLPIGEGLQDLVISAVNEAVNQIETTTEEEMSKITGGVSLPGLF